MDRVAPARAIQKWEIWRRWSTVWRSLHLITGGSASVLAALVAANTKGNFIVEPWNWIIAVAAAGLTFIVSAIGAQARGSSFETAARELEKGITEYETNPAFSEVDLGKAEKRGVDILNRLKR